MKKPLPKGKGEAKVPSPVPLGKGRGKALLGKGWGKAPLLMTGMTPLHHNYIYNIYMICFRLTGHP